MRSYWGKYFDGLMRKKHNSIANALELCLFCIKPSRQQAELSMLRPGTPVLETIFNKYLIFEFSTGNSFLLLGL